MVKYWKTKFEFQKAKSYTVLTMGLFPGPFIFLCCESPEVGIYIFCSVSQAQVNCTHCLKSWCAKEQTSRNSNLLISSSLTEINVVLKEQSILGAYKIDVNQRMHQREGNMS